MQKNSLMNKKALLLSYSLVKIDSRRHKVWIHPVVHKWTHECYSGAEKREQTQQVSDLIAQAIKWSSTKDADGRLAFSRDILPDTKACVQHITKYLSGGSESNQESWNSFKILHNFLMAQGMYKTGITLAKVLMEKDQNMSLGQDHPSTLASMNNLACRAILESGQIC